MTPENEQGTSVQERAKRAIEGSLFDREGKPLGYDRFTELDADEEYRVLDQTEVGVFVISTVWDGQLEPRYRPPAVKRPMIFATGVFWAPGGIADMDGSREPLMQFRYPTAEEARQGHDSIVADWRAQSGVTATGDPSA